MAVHKYVREGDGATVYCAAYLGPDQRRRVEKAVTVKADGSKKDHERAETAARKKANDQRIAIENGTWKDPNAAKVASLPFSKLVERFLRDYRSASGKVEYYEQRASVWKAHYGE